MSFDHTLRAFVSSFDGTKKEFSEIEVLFEAVFDDEYIQVDGDTLNKSQMKQVHTNFLAMGTTATLLHCKVHGGTADFKIRMTNEKVDVIVHFSATLRDGKLLQAKAHRDSVESLLEARNYLLNFYEVESKMRSYASAYDGNAKEFSAEIGRAFEALYHDDFEYHMGDKHLTRHELKQKVPVFLSEGTKAELIEFKPIGRDIFELKSRTVNSIVNITSHSLGIIKDGKLLSIEVMPDALQSYDQLSAMFGLCEVKQNLKTYIKLQNSSAASAEDISRLVDELFDDAFVGSIEGFEFGKEDMRAMMLHDFAERAHFALEKCEIIDDSHIELEFSNGGKRCHDYITVDAERRVILKIQSYDTFKETMPINDDLANSEAVAVAQ